jgi:hypothetical protein
MRGEGTRAEVSRSTAEFKAWRSCTSLFHHGDTKDRKQQKKERLKQAQIRCRPPLRERPATTDQRRLQTTPTDSCLSFSA